MKKKTFKISDAETAFIHSVIVEFGLAMKSASRDYIARTGRMTDRMNCIWEVYREWCANHPEPK